MNQRKVTSGGDISEVVRGFGLVRAGASDHLDRANRFRDREVPPSEGLSHSWAGVL